MSRYRSKILDIDVYTDLTLVNNFHNQGNIEPRVDASSTRLFFCHVRKPALDFSDSVADNTVVTLVI